MRVFLAVQQKYATGSLSTKPLKWIAVFFLVSLMVSGCGAHKASDVLYWGSVPNEEGMKILKTMGCKLIINLRTNSHKGRAKYANSLGIKMEHINCGVVKTPEEKELRRFITLVADPKNHPVFLSCNVGIDRTSYFVAAYRIAVEGWTVPQALAEARVHGLKKWWPTFREYEDSLRSNEALMRRLAKEFPSHYVAYDASKLPCPCFELNKKTLELVGEYKEDAEEKQRSVYKLKPASAAVQ